MNVICVLKRFSKIKNIDGKESDTIKRVNIATRFNEFKDTLFNKKVVRHKMKRISSKKHKIKTYEINKISLSCFDDGIHTHTYFHKDLRNRFPQIIINKKRFSKMVTTKKRFSQIKIGSDK